MLHYAFSSAAENNVFKPSAPMRWHHYQIGRNVSCKLTDFIPCRSAAENVADCRRDTVFACQSIKFFEKTSFSLLLIRHERKRHHWRNGSHKVPRIIKLANMR